MWLDSIVVGWVSWWLSWWNQRFAVCSKCSLEHWIYSAAWGRSEKHLKHNLPGEISVYNQETPSWMAQNPQLHNHQSSHLVEVGWGSLRVKLLRQSSIDSRSIITLKIMWKQSRSVWRQKQVYTCLEPKTKPRTQRLVPCKAQWGRDIDELISLLHKIWFCSLTKNYMVSVYFPGWAVGQLGGVEVGVLLSIRTHRLDHLPTNFIMRFLYTEIKRNQILWWIHEVTWTCSKYLTVHATVMELVLLFS